MTITLTILAVALAVLSGIAKAICDLSEEGVSTTLGTRVRYKAIYAGKRR